MPQVWLNRDEKQISRKREQGEDEPRRSGMALRLLPLVLVALLLVACGGRQAIVETPLPVATEGDVAEGDVPEEAAIETPTTQPESPTVAPTLAPTATVPIQATISPTASLTLRVAINPEFQPFVYKDENGNVVGFDIDLLNAMAAAGGFEVVYAAVPFSEIFTGLEEGRFDAAISALSITDARLQRVNFTDLYFDSGNALVSYFGAGQGLAVPVDNTTIQSVADLTSDMLVGVKAGTTGEDYVRENTPVRVRTFTEAPTALDALRAGEIDAVVLDIAVMARSIGAAPLIKLVGPPITREQYAIAVPKGRPQVLARLNEALTQIREDGTHATLVEQWFGSP